MYWQSKRLYWEGALAWRAAAWANPGGLLCHGLAVSGFMLIGLAFRVVSGQSSCLCPYLVWVSWWRAHLSAKMDSRMRVSGRLAYILGWRLLPPWAPPEFSRLVFSGSTMFLIRACCGETARANGYYHRAWPRQAVSVDGSQTLSGRKNIGLEFFFMIHYFVGFALRESLIIFSTTCFL